MAEDQKVYEGWAILEVMGHRRLGGYVTEVNIAGAGFLRIDVPGPGGEPVATQFYPPSSVYCMTPVAESMARAVALRNQPQPVSRWELPAPAQPEAVGVEDGDEDDEAGQGQHEGDEDDDPGRYF